MNDVLVKLKKNIKKEDKKIEDKLYQHIDEVLVNYDEFTLDVYSDVFYLMYLEEEKKRYWKYPF